MILKKTFYTSLRNINLVKYKITNNLYDSNKRQKVNKLNENNEEHK